MSSYLRPTNLEDALHHLASVPATVIAGGTDFYPARVGRPVDEAILDISAIEELRGISTTSRHWRIGATTTWRDLLDAELPGCFDGLRAAARQVGGQQVQNVATVAGNLCNASPAADGVPPLLSLDAVVEIHGANGVRLLPLADFVLGNRRTALEGSDLLTAVLVPKAWEGARGGFLKLGARSSLVISIVMVAGTLTVDAHGSVERAALAIGACAETARRLPELEAALRGRPADGDLAGLVSPAHFQALSPIDDHRGTAAYRLDAAATLCRRLLLELASSP